VIGGGHRDPFVAPLIHSQKYHRAASNARPT